MGPEFDMLEPGVIAPRGDAVDETEDESFTEVLR